MLRVVLLGLFGLALAGPAFSQPAPLRAELDRQCPTKHLERLSPGGLHLGIDTFQRLSPDAGAAITRLSRAGAACGRKGGLVCANAALVGAAEQLDYLPAVTASICSQYETCRVEGACKRTPEFSTADPSKAVPAGPDTGEDDQPNRSPR